MYRAFALLLLAAGFVAAQDDVPMSNSSIQAGEFRGQASYLPWSGIWWPMEDGYLGRGWNGVDTFTYDEAHKKYVAKTGVALNDLSPLAKYDKFVELETGRNPGSALYELTAEGNWMHHVYGKNKEKFDEEDVDYSWWGHCNGWAAAAALEDEPVSPIEARGIRFDVADVKGILTESYFGVVADFTGRRYNKPGEEIEQRYDKAKELLEGLRRATPPAVAEYRTWAEKAYGWSRLPNGAQPRDFKPLLESYLKQYEDRYTKAFEDLRPDVFHKIVTTVIGQQKGVVVFDISANESVWNYPAYRYETKIREAGMRRIDGDNRRVFECRTTVHYADDGVSESILGVNSFTRVYTYELFTTPARRKLRGGKWTGESVEEHPDFAWYPKYNPTGPDSEENVKLLYGNILKILPKHHEQKESRPFELMANGIGSDSRRGPDRSLTFGNPVEASTTVTFSHRTTIPGVARVRYYEQKVKGSGDEVKATRDPLVPLGEGASVTATLTRGIRMIVAHAFDSAGRLLAIDEIAVKVP